MEVAVLRCGTTNFYHAKQALLHTIDNEMVKEHGRICLIRSHLNTAFLYINKVKDEANGI